MSNNTSLRSGLLVSLVGPSGAGKSYLSKLLVEKFPNINLSVSATTRSPREGEVDSEHYYFLTRDEFEAKIKNGDIFEYEEVHGNLYGTLRKVVDTALKDGHDLLFDIDVRGAKTIKKNFHSNSIVIFVLPPSKDELLSRIKARSSMSESELNKRLETAVEELRALEEGIISGGFVDYVIVNDSKEDAFAVLSAIVVAEAHKGHRYTEDYMLNLLKGQR